MFLFPKRERSKLEPESRVSNRVKSQNRAGPTGSGRWLRCQVKAHHRHALYRGQQIRRHGLAVYQINPQQEALVAAERKLSTILNKMPVGVVAADLATQQFYLVNDEFCRMLGYAREELLGKTPACIHPADEMPRIRAEFERIVQGEMPRAQNITVMRKDGKRFPVDIQPVEFELEGARTVLGVFNDVTPIQEAMRALQASEAKYRHLIENLRGEYFFYTIDTDGTLSYVSPSATAMMGWTPEEMLGPYQPFITDHPVNAQVQPLTEAGLCGEKPPPYLLQARHKDGSTRWLEMSETPVFNEQGQVTGLEGCGPFCP